jgi:uncharacterized membrane protein
MLVDHLFQSVYGEKAKKMGQVRQYEKQPDLHQESRDRREVARRRPRAVRRSNGDVESTERTASLVGGGLLLFYMLRNRTPIGITAGAVGAELMFRGITGRRYLHEWVAEQLPIGDDKPIEVQKSVIVNRPLEEVFNYWRNFENLPSFMSHVRSVRAEEDGRSHWAVHISPKMDLEWDARITEERPNELIAWESLPNSSVQTWGRVRFAPATGNRGTQVTATLAYEPPGGVVGAAFARLQETMTAEQIKEDMRRFKQMMEAGEIATTRGQSACR